VIGYNRKYAAVNAKAKSSQRLAGQFETKSRFMRALGASGAPDSRGAGILTIDGGSDGAFL
jgi:hypothetical protein